MTSARVSAFSLPVHITFFGFVVSPDECVILLTMTRPLLPSLCLGILVCACAVTAARPAPAAPPEVLEVHNQAKPTATWPIVGEEIHHTAGTVGGATQNPYAIERPGSIALVGRFSGNEGSFACEIRSDGAAPNAGVGLVFGFQDPHNHYRLRIPLGKDYCDIVRFADGRPQLLYRGPHTLRRNRWRDLVFRFQDSTAILEFERVYLALGRYDPAGKGIGLYAWNNNSVKVRNVRLSEERNPHPELVLFHPTAGLLSLDATIRVEATVLGDVAAPPWVHFRIDPEEVSSQSVSKGAPLSVAFNGIAPGEHVLEAVLEIGDNKRDPVVVAPVGIGERWVALGDGLTYGLGDDLLRDDVSRDERNNFGGFTPILSDALTARLEKPVVVACEGIPGRTVQDVHHELPDILARHPGAPVYLVLLGGEDLRNGSPAFDASAFYDDLKEIVARIQEEGARVVLAKIPPVGKSEELWSACNAAIERIAAEANLPPPPDFAALFQQQPELLGADHFPTGPGYQAMVPLWLDAVIPAPVAADVPAATAPSP